MIRTKCVITCDGFAQGFLPARPCSSSPLELDHAPDEAELAALLAEHEYTVDAEGRYWCRAHDPSTAGTLVTIGAHYTRLAPGVVVRAAVPVSSVFPFVVEVRTGVPEEEGENGAE